MALFGVGLVPAGTIDTLIRRKVTYMHVLLDKLAKPSVQFGRISRPVW